MQTIITFIDAVSTDYPRPPGVLRYEFCNETGSLTVSWTQASTEDRGRSRKYIVQIKEPPGEEWRSLSTTTKKLLVSLTGIKPKTKLRVCSSGEIGYDESSCSKPIDPVVRK